jgi:hypothetical protein
MKIKKLFFWGLQILSQVVISQTNNDNLIRVKSDFDNAGKVKMSELISEIRYLPLETNPDCLLGYMNVPVFGKNILIRSNDGSGNILRFSDSGKFLNKIGRQGRGPGEYLDNCDVLLFGDTVYVVSNFSNSIYCYSLAGTFLKKYRLDIPPNRFSKEKLPGSPSSIVKMPDNSFMVSLGNSSGYGRLIKTDASFRVIKGFLKNNPLRYTPYPLPLSETKRGIFYFYSVIDTIYEISRGYPVPSIVIDHGKYSKPKGFVSTPGDLEDDLKYPEITFLSMSDNYLKMELYYGPKSLMDIVFYRFSDGKTVNLTSLINDIDNGTMDKWFGFLTRDNQLVITLFPTTILERYGKMTSAEKSDPKNSRFVQMASTITAGSNPVLMICKLK